MAKKSKKTTDETTVSEIGDENTSFVDVIADDLEAETTAIMEETPVVKRKVAVRKKKSKIVGAKEVKVKKVSVKKARSTRIDSGDPSTPAPVMKAFWGVFNQMMVQVAQYSYADEAEARKTANDLSEKKKTPHFVQLIKKVL